VINRKHIHIHILLICSLLLIGQFGVLIHSIEHPFHISEQSCQTFITLEQSDDSLAFDNLLLVIKAINIPVIIAFVELSLLTQTVYHSRAPPALL